MAVTATFGTMIAAPAVKLLAVDFPDTIALLVQWVVTMSSLFILPTLFLAGRLCQFLSPLFVSGVELLLRTDSTREVFMAVAIALAVTAVIYLRFARNRKHAAVRSSIS